MALSKKDQINIKLNAAKDGLERAVARLAAQLDGHSPEAIREDDELSKLQNEKRLLESQIRDIYKLFETSGKKKQTARLILAECHGQLKNGEWCGYKIRASMSTLLRGVPNCPDPMCKRKGKPFEIEIREDEIDEQIDAAFNLPPKEEMAQQVADAERRKQEMKTRAAKAGMPRFVLPHNEQAQSVEEQTAKDQAEFDALVAKDEEWLTATEVRNETKPEGEKK